MQRTTQLISSQTTLDDTTIEKVFGKILSRGLELQHTIAGELDGPDGEWKLEQDAGRIAGLAAQGTVHVGSPDDIQELIVSLPWPKGTLSSTQELLLTERGGYLLRIREFVRTAVTDTQDVRNATVVNYVPQANVLTAWQAYDIGEFQATVNGEEVGGWGVAGMRFVDPPAGNDLYGTINGENKTFNPDNVVEDQPEGTVQSTELPRYFRVGQLIINLYGVWSHE